MVAPGNPIKLADLTALAAAANAKTQLPFDVVPMFLANDGVTKLGYATAFNFNFNSGVLYKAGDIVTVGGGTSFRIGGVDGTGKPLGLVVISSGAWSPNAAAPGNNATGGSGNGLTITFSTHTIGPQAAYNFPDFTQGTGTLTGFYLINAGKNYHPGDTLTVPAVAGSVTVQTVDAAGGLATFGFNTVFSGPNVPPMPYASTGGTGTGATFGAYYVINQKPVWLTELNRLRGNLNQLSLPAGTQSISGRWPGVAGVDQEFYYADDGTPQNCVLTIPANDPSTGFNTVDPDYSSGPLAFQQPVTSLTCQVIIGGSQPVTFTGNFQFSVEAGDASVVTDFPGAVFSAGGGAATPTFTATVNPGTYTFKATCTGGVGASFANPVMSGNAKITMTVSTPQPASGIHNSLPISKIVIPPTPPGSGQFPFGFFIFAAGPYKNGYQTVANSSFIIVNPTFAAGFFTNTSPLVWGGTWWQSQPAKIVPSTTGFFTSKQKMIASLNPATSAQMPWNQLRHSANGAIVSNPMLLGNQNGNASISNSYDNTQPVESQSEPSVWKPSTFFSPGFIIEDSNGNIQTVVTGGISAPTGLSGANGIYAPPQWSTVVGGLTPEAHPDVPFASTLVWKCLKVIAPKSQFAPAVHRPVCVPRYPFYWLSETQANLKPPGSGTTIWGAANQWARNNYTNSGHATFDLGWQVDNMAAGWWIYSITINRIGTNQKGKVLLPTQDAAGNVQQIPVTIGCMRNGAFTAFGTYQTGQTIQVLWPIFTSDALVYDATERVDIQAVVIAANGNGAGGSVSQGATAAGYPISAAFVNDTLALLQLIS